MSGYSEHDGAPALPHGFSRRRIASAISSRVLELIMLPTEKCNFRCTYCYEDFLIGRMSETTQHAIEQLLERRVPKLTTLRFSWFGGEPLLAKDVVLRISEYAHRLCQECHVKFRGSITTNAFVLKLELAKRLLACQQTFFQVTFDGWQQGHDAVRRRANGLGTFQQIWDNLASMRMLDTPFEVCIRVHVRSGNIDSLRTLVNNIGVTFGSDSRYRVDFQTLKDLGGEGGKTVTEIVDSAKMKRIQRELRDILSKATGGTMHVGVDGVQDEQEQSGPIGESAGSRSLSDLVAGEPYICYAAQPNSLLIRANGRVGKCTVALSDDRNDIGYIKPDGTLEIDRVKLHPWIRGLSDLDLAAVSCPLSVLP